MFTPQVYGRRARERERERQERSTSRTPIDLKSNSKPKSKSSSDKEWLTSDASSSNSTCSSDIEFESDNILSTPKPINQLKTRKALGDSFNQNDAGGEKDRDRTPLALKSSSSNRQIQSKGKEKSSSKAVSSNSKDPVSRKLTYQDHHIEENDEFGACVLRENKMESEREGEDRKEKKKKDQSKVIGKSSIKVFHKGKENIDPKSKFQFFSSDSEYISSTSTSTSTSTTTSRDSSRYRNHSNYERNMIKSFSYYDQKEEKELGAETGTGKGKKDDIQTSRPSRRVTTKNINYREPGEDEIGRRPSPVKSKSKLKSKSKSEENHMVDDLEQEVKKLGIEEKGKGKEKDRMEDERISQKHSKLQEPLKDKSKSRKATSSRYSSTHSKSREDEDDEKGVKEDESDDDDFGSISLKSKSKSKYESSSFPTKTAAKYLKPSFLQPQPQLQDQVKSKSKSSSSSKFSSTESHSMTSKSQPRVQPRSSHSKMEYEYDEDSEDELDLIGLPSSSSSLSPPPSSSSSSCHFSKRSKSSSNDLEDRRSLDKSNQQVVKTSYEKEIRSFNSSSNYNRPQKNSIPTSKTNSEELKLKLSSLKSSKTSQKSQTNDDDDEDEDDLVQNLLQTCHPIQEKILDFQEILNELLNSFELKGTKGRGRQIIKIGEASYSEVFIIDSLEDQKEIKGKEKIRKKNWEIGQSVLKIIPISNPNLSISKSKQKEEEEEEKPEESEMKDVIREISIAKALGVRNDLEEWNGFGSFRGAHLVQGSYPTSLLSTWTKYSSINPKLALNPSPSIFSKDQLYLILHLPFGGKDLESVKLNSWKDCASIFWQSCKTLMLGEIEWDLEHRDLHWGNLLVSFKDENCFASSLKVSLKKDIGGGGGEERKKFLVGSPVKKIGTCFKNQNNLNSPISKRGSSVGINPLSKSKKFNPILSSSITSSIPITIESLSNPKTSNLQVSLIDFSLSRMKLKKDGEEDDNDNDDAEIIMNDFQDPCLFEGKGDEQFQVYRDMKTLTEEDWEGFHPGTNVLWLHYLTSKLIHSKGLRSPLSISKSTSTITSTSTSKTIFDSDLEKKAYTSLISVRKIMGQEIKLLLNKEERENISLGSAEDIWKWAEKRSWWN